MIAAMAEARPYKDRPYEMTFSGWGVATEIDQDGDGSTATSNTYDGKGTFGKSTTNNQVETGSFIGLCGDGILKFGYTAFTAVTRYRNGDLIFPELDTKTANSSILCFDLSNLTYTATIKAVISGGTGRFKGATGWVIGTLAGGRLAGDGARITHAFFTGSQKGEIVLAHD